MLNHVLLPLSHAVTYPAMQQRINRLLRDRAQAGSDKEAIDRHMWELYGETWAVMFTDLAGFSRATERFGITHFLQVIFESFRVYIPIVEEHDGVLLKVEGDSMLVLFRHAKSALDCALAMQRAGDRYNRKRPLEERLLLSIGLGYGPVLKFGDQDVYGQEVNVACKLGEDIGEPGDILCSEAFRSQFSGARPGFDPSAKSPRGTSRSWRIRHKAK
ncbi:MAG: adenylate/guanylate cyclase domain-containing protein [Planctomycetes bacterium]|nr:adenylate/guanylate cyclase domain-containing protein [Planctomycetota bacterium]